LLVGKCPKPSERKGKERSKYAGYRYGKDRTKYRQAMQAGGIIGKGFAGCFWFCNAAGYLQVAAGGLRYKSDKLKKAL